MPYEPYRRPDGTTLDKNQFMAIVLVEQGMRNSYLEELHAGVFPDSAAGDYSDVKVVNPYGEIPWNRVSRISDEEMKRLMIDVVDRIYSLLVVPDFIGATRSRALAAWKVPELHETLIQSKRMLGQKDL